MNNIVKHCVIYDTGRDHWQYGEKRPGDSRTCLGPCPKCGTRTIDFGCGWACTNYCCSYGVANVPCGIHSPPPAWWDTDIRVQLDGDSWCANRTSFVNLQESPAGFGFSPEKAVEMLHEAEKIVTCDAIATTLTAVGLPSIGEGRSVTITVIDAMVTALASAAWQPNSRNPLLALLRAVDPNNEVIQIRDRQARENGYVRCDSDERLPEPPAPPEPPVESIERPRSSTIPCVDCGVGVMFKDWDIHVCDSKTRRAFQEHRNG